MNCYANLTEAKAALNRSQTGGDDGLLLALNDASRLIETLLAGRHFYALWAQTRYTEWTSSRGGRRSLRLPFDLPAAPTTVKVDDNEDDTYEFTLVVNTDYVLRPRNKLAGEPYTGLWLNPNGTQIGAWPRGEARVQVVGKVGYSDQVESVGTIAEDLDTSETGVDLTAGHSVRVGATIRVGSEDMYVSALPSTNTATVTRAVNGSTAATHTNGDAVSARVFPEDIRRACIVKATDILRGGQGGYGATSGDPTIGGFASRDAWYEFRRLIEPFRNRWGVA